MEWIPKVVPNENIKLDKLEEPAHKRTFKDLKDLCIELQLNSYDLENLVCDIFPSKAETVNQAGIQAQIGLLASQVPYDYIEGELRAIAKNSWHSQI